MLLLRALLGAALLVGAASTGQAQTPCGKRAAIVETLQNKYQEVPAAMGIAGQKDLLEIYASPAGTWTILMTMPSGLTCIMAAGQSWEAIPYKPKLTGL